MLAVMQFQKIVVGDKQVDCFQYGKLHDADNYSRLTNPLSISYTAKVYWTNVLTG